MECLRSHATPVHMTHLKTLISLLMRKGCSTDFMQLNTRAWDGCGFQTNYHTCTLILGLFVSGWSYGQCTVTYYTDNVWGGVLQETMWVGKTCADGNSAFCVSIILKQIRGEANDGGDGENVDKKERIEERWSIGWWVWNWDKIHTPQNMHVIHILWDEKVSNIYNMQL